MATKKKDNFNDYADFLKKVGMNQLDGVDVTHDGYPLSAKESKFISLFIANGNVNKSLREANLTMRAIAGKDYITDEITYRLDQLKKETNPEALKDLLRAIFLYNREANEYYGV